MRYIRIEGQTRLSGEINVAGSKNALLPIIPASLMVDGCVTIYNVPNISDVTNLKEMISQIGVNVSEVSDGCISINSSNITSHEILQFTSRTRGSILLAAPLLHRFGKANIAMPGGCNIGDRLIDFHIAGLQAMGASVSCCGDLLQLFVSTKDGRLHGAEITFPNSSVGATEHIMIAAVLAKGETVMHNAAMEPEIAHLADFLTKCGADISGIGTRTIRICGVDKLYSTKYVLPPDRLESTTYSIVALGTGGEVDLLGCNLESFHHEVIGLLGGRITKSQGGTVVSSASSKINGLSVITGVYPGFPTDLQAPIAPLLCVNNITNGRSTIRETIFNSRFGHVSQLNKMGANISIIEDDTIEITPVDRLVGAKVHGTDLRSTKALIIAGLMAYGVTEIRGLEYLHRGYENIVHKLKNLGASIEELDDHAEVLS